MIRRIFPLFYLSSSASEAALDIERLHLAPPIKEGDPDSDAQHLTLLRISNLILPLLWSLMLEPLSRLTA